MEGHLTAKCLIFFFYRTVEIFIYICVVCLNESECCWITDSALLLLCLKAERDSCLFLCCSCLKNKPPALLHPPASSLPDRSLSGPFRARARTSSPGSTLGSVVLQQLVITSIYLLLGSSDKVVPESYKKKRGRGHQ